MNLKATSRIARWGWLLFLPRFGCSRFHLPVRNNLLAILVGLCVLIVPAIQTANAIQLNSDSQLATAGYYQLSWSGKSGVFQLQESPTADFNSYKVIYTGRDLARIVSGKPNGDYYYRIADDNNGDISNVVAVTVAHHPLKNAILFFCAGAFVFISTLILIIKGNRRVDG
jgi:hypothetical protein